MKKAMQHSAISAPCNAPACANTIVTPAEENVNTLSSTNVRLSNEDSTFYSASADTHERMTGRPHMNISTMQLAMQNNCIDCADGGTVVDSSSSKFMIHTEGRG